MRVAMLVPLILTPLLHAQQSPSIRTRLVRELGPAVAHYQALGFSVSRRDRARVQFARRSGCKLVVERARGEQAAGPAARDEALVVGVRDLAAERRRLERSDIRYQELVARPSAITSLLVFDLDGYRTILRPKRDLDSVAIPAPGELNPLVVAVMAGFPSDGTHRYYWPRNGGWKGNTKDLEYGGEVFAPGDPEGRCYCCGLTFEVMLDAWRLWCARNGRPWRIAGLDTAGVQKLQRQWFGSAADKSCLHTALTDNGLGSRITDWDAARAGDFVQLWRANGSGHSVVFLAWQREGGAPSGRITGIRYWSTQTATRGIGERVESFEESAGKKRVLRDQFWLCRVGDPAVHQTPGRRQRGPLQPPRRG